MQKTEEVSQEDDREVKEYFERREEKCAGINSRKDNDELNTVHTTVVYALTSSAVSVFSSLSGV